MILLVKVKPNAKKNRLEQQADGSWIAQIKAPPVDGKANSELIRVVADHFKVAKSRVSLLTGASGRLKRIQVDIDD